MITEMLSLRGPISSLKIANKQSAIVELTGRQKTFKLEVSNELRLRVGDDVTIIYLNSDLSRLNAYGFNNHTQGCKGWLCESVATFPKEPLVTVESLSVLGVVVGTVLGTYLGMEVNIYASVLGIALVFVSLRSILNVPSQQELNEQWFEIMYEADVQNRYRRIAIEMLEE